MKFDFEFEHCHKKRHFLLLYFPLLKLKKNQGLSWDILFCVLCRIASKAFFFLHFSSNCGNKFLFNKFIAIKFVVIYEVDSGKTNHSCQTMDYENIFTNLPEQRIVKRESILAFTVKNTYTRFKFFFLFNGTFRYTISWVWILYVYSGKSLSSHSR